ncbi:hypothetical protein [Bordetella genomosp. 1]|uniref:Disulfide bond formation protein B n=1 Tax=Bordetella genomosp. 1 TaxID=1395607 RepID=A0ABX4EYH3_9BORD|nr:hypothetical protein [Bordetella genomosp. 1]OZI64070.1 hypothetical protein CAL27_15930 [Bordetella genomosp. 1]
MNPTINKWGIPVLAGLVTGYLVQGPLQFWLYGNAPFLAPLLALAVAALVAWILARRVAEDRRLGWALVTVGVAVGFYAFAVLVPTLFQQGGLDRDEKTAAFFVFLIMGLPMIVIMLGLIIGGVVLLRRAGRARLR